MENKTQSNFIPGFALAFMFVSIANAALVILKEANEDLKELMAGLLGHHWVTHGVFIIILFFVLGLLFSRIQYNEQWFSTKTAMIVFIGAVIGGVLIVFSPFF